MGLDLISLCIGLASGAAIVAAIFLPQLAALKEKLKGRETAEAEMGNAFSVMAQEALRQSNEQFLQLAQEKLKNAQADGVHDMEKKQKAISDMVTPVKEHLEKLNNAVEQIKGTDNALREDLKNLQKETAKLTGALRNPTEQGRWGEYILERLLDKSGLIKGVHYDSQVTLNTDDGRQRPDFVINLHDGFNIVIDAKAPINEFADALQNDISEEEYRGLMKKLAKQVRDHIRKLGNKNYWEQLDSPDFVVMFLPSEHMFSAALRADPDLVDFAAEQRIIIASPTLILSLLRVVGLSWRQVELAKNAQEISTMASELYKRLSVFGGHIEKVGKGLQGAINSYNSAVGSLERKVLPQARRIKDLHVNTGGKDLPDIDPIETTPRAIEAQELLSEEKEHEAA